ncbi:MAG: glycolate oxidase [Candidatus Binatia bacterium]|nr:MAG: glycolate oxidase [Candidatus Binatia bacterium]
MGRDESRPSGSELTRVLRERLGSEWLEDAGPEYAVGPARPETLAKPRSLEEVRELVAVCRSLGLALVPWGSGTHQHVGNAPSRLDVVLSTRDLSGIVDHDPADLTVTVRAGTTLAELASMLRPSGQWLPLDPPAPDRVTVGGMIAADLNGGLRFSHGRVRDWVLGLTFVDGVGRVVRGGGRVVKNVAGYDIPKLLVGSYGSLGPVVEATFQVRPLPACDRTFGVSAPSLEDAFRYATDIFDGPCSPLALDVLDAGAAAGLGLGKDPFVVVRLGGETREVEMQRDGMASFLRGLAPLEPAQCAALRDFTLRGPGSWGARFAVSPRELVHVALRAEEEASRFGLPLYLRVHFGTGVGFVRLSAESSKEVEAALGYLRWLRFLCRRFGGFCVYEQLPADCKALVDPWGPLDATLELMRGVKAALDPRRIFNPGRYCGGL